MKHRILQEEEIERTAFLLPDGCHPTDALFFLTAGEIFVQMQGKTFSAKAGDVVCFPKEMPFHREVLQNMRAWYLLFESTEAPVPGKWFFTDTARVQSTAAFFEKTSTGSPQRWHLWEDLFLQRELEQNARPVDAHFAETVKRLYETPVGTFTPTQAAACLHLSRSAFFRQFQQVYQEPPLQWATRMRMEMAKRLLRNSDLSLTAIAAQCGYDNAFYFSRVFVRHVGCRPAAYRHKFLL